MKNEEEEMQHRKMRRENMKEKLRGIEGRTRGPKLPLKELWKEKNGEDGRMGE